MIILTIPGKPMGKQRARAVSMGKFTKVYTPKETVNYETLIKELFIITYPHHVPIDGPVTMQINVYYPIPKTTSQKKRQAIRLNELRPTVKPDIDNVIKIICDALNGLAYVDDNRIITIQADKYYCDQPRVEIKIKETLI